mmetsp:Transcript_31343/g.78659  ORF Transcript_31343/g.78659 Transcript_31343/m.78659 type:complete len:308 (-) Transcript_31343:122-1045(-)|eukprot:CAMPEP_0177655846 /NCGR_PEP_ID=MMETSP0447-20121125/15211_1 /TAXON_ID=0 /ORGANISM="Stygamoeba regulata, Strain BSH-02190019" /LENGTH=307 /DNA_ID=CAMNT_0019159845 /DNA_START=246 /DNA_END=1169 /DNA_ORIENTATION=+
MVLGAQPYPGGVGAFFATMPTDDWAAFWAWTDKFDATKYLPFVDDYPLVMPLVTVSLYVAFVKWFGPHVLQPNLKPLSLRPILITWNLFLSVLSAVMLYGMCAGAVPRLLSHGWYGVVCDPDRSLYLGNSLFWVWVFNMSKYAELFDTVLLILRHRPVSLLHWYHHASVLTFCWFQMLIKAGSIGYIFAIMNCAVHTLMYFYYFLTSLGYSPTWGRYLTLMQLSQMVVGIAIPFAWSAYHFTGHRCPCDHIPTFFTSTIVVYGSYFILFLRFYLQRWGKAEDPTKTKTMEDAQHKNTPKKTKSKKID